jgi:hypothetical protein
MGVPRMAAILYETYILISRPDFDKKLGAWIPYASVAWDGDKYHYHQLTKLGKSFETREEAEAYGFVVARAWIDEHKSD